MNPLENYYQNGTFAEGNTTITYPTAGGYYSSNVGTIGMTAGKFYWEQKPTTAQYTAIRFGISSTQVTASGSTMALGVLANDWGYFGEDGEIYNNNSGTSYGDTYDEGDIIGIALDLDNNKLYFAKNGTWQNSGDPTSGATGTGAISITAPASTPLGAYFPAGHVFSSGNFTLAYNFGNPPFTISSGNADANSYGNFEYAPPSGYLALCTKNLGSDGG